MHTKKNNRYRLKKKSPEFDLVDGPLKGRKYRHGQQYDQSEIPEREMDRFEVIKSAAIPSEEKKPTGAQRKAQGPKTETKEDKEKA